ncbi:AI-2E family transporter [Weissella diestrammenae]|uniref:AI-2E family transporter n=1 Tax=Weissella diestrammenae TaxID=1162633 RepID=A0A7G9T764_9LACO|nr:AI-2E family transporter [Weissella diestrammenae]MCM0582459.1 AI-2E family transporter [Weissella diestrammenae]QNN75939.1 AI-2E family transporter [Weissella diestrammenae]
MLDKLRQKTILFWSLELLVIALLLLVVSQLSFILEPIFKFIGAVFIPVLISGLLFYILNPIVNLIVKIKLSKSTYVPRWAASLLMVFILLVLVGASAAALLPKVVDQISNLIKMAPVFINEGKHWVEMSAKWHWIKTLGLSVNSNTIQEGIQKYGTHIINGMANGAGQIASSIIGYLVYALTVPVMTFYMLNDGHKLVPFIKKWFPSRQDDVGEVAERIHDTLSHYIMGQVFEMIYVGVATGIGYVMIGQKYALLLGVIAGIANIVPYLGPYIGIVPALFVALTMGGWQVLWTIIVVGIVHLIDGNIIYPRIIGGRLNIHPLTIIILLLAAGNVAGALGMILVIPAYAIVRTLVVYLWDFFYREREATAQNVSDN